MSGSGGSGKKGSGSGIGGSEPPDLEGLDWDAALDEWENKTFVPEVAKDTQSERPASLAGPAGKPPAHKPMVPAAGGPPRPDVKSAQARPVMPVVPEHPRTEPHIHDRDEEDEDEQSGATVIARIPKELLRGAGKADEGPKSAGGGLGQLFAKTGEMRVFDGESGSVEVAIDVAQQGKVTSRPPPPDGSFDEGEPSVVTSAKHMAPASKPAFKDAPLKRPSQVDEHEAVAHDGLFDPFAEPDTVVRRERVAPPRTNVAPAPPPNSPLMPTPVPPSSRRASSLPPPLPPSALMPPARPGMEEADPFAAAGARRADRVSSLGEEEDDPFRDQPTRASLAPSVEAASMAEVDESELEDLEATVAKSGRAELGAASLASDEADTAEIASADDGVAELLAAGADGRIEPQSPGPALLAPDQRQYDPNDETFVASKKQLAQKLAPRPEIDLVGVGEDEDEDATRVRSRSEAQIDAAPATRAWPDEKPATEWLDDARRRGLGSRAAWLESEARAVDDKLARARALLAVSEIRAVLGEIEAAEALAVEARDLSPTIALAHRQARALAPSSRDATELALALDVEARHSPSAPARVHIALLAADAMRRAGDDDGASKRLDQALRIAPTDVRAPVLRAARALARGETASAALRMPDVPELMALSSAIAAALRLRGVEPSHAKSTRASQPDAIPPEEPTAHAAHTANETLRRARAALDKGDVVGAASLLAELRRVPGLARGAIWLAAALGATRSASRRESAEWLRTLAGEDGDLAKRALAARGLELGDPAIIEQAIAAGPTFSPAERATIATLVGLDDGARWADLDALLGAEGMRPLAAALGAVTTVASDDESRESRVRARADRVAGSPASRGAVRLARLIAAAAPAQDIEAAIAMLGEAAPPTARAVALEMAIRGERFVEVSDALSAWTGAGDSSEAQRDRHLAAALVAERAGDAPRALAAFREAKKADAGCDAALRAIAALDPQVDLVAELNALADDLGEGPRGAILRLEAIARGEISDPPIDAETRAMLLDRAHRAAPALPVASFLAAQMARRAGNADEVLRWVRERRATLEDPLERALDGVREALLVADKEPALAGERLQEAHAARPSDVALRELYERMSPESPDDRGAWREQRATQANGPARSLFFLEAAHEYERAGDKAASLRAAEAAAAADNDGLGRAARERAEVEGGQVARLADELLALAKGTDDPRERREAYERLAVLDAVGRDDTASALLWHRSILEESPQHLPSLRYLEHALIGGGRDDELEPIASAIARALGPAGGEESSSHAELAARLLLRGASGDWEATRDLVDIAAAQPAPSLWALRMTQAHARARGDDRAFLAVTEALIERITRANEAASLLVRAGEAASRLEDLDKARSLLERAAMEDPGDVVTWGQLADVRQRAGDARGAAEACESLARTSVVAEHQLLAWYDAGRIWLDEVKDEERGAIALEQAAAIDVTFEDTFQRLSAMYAARKASGELASLLERRLERVTDPDERMGIEVERGKVLVDIGDLSGARASFEAALRDRPDHVAALGALAELCAQEKDWDAAEQAWVRLARLLPNPEEQRVVYSHLGDLYAKHAVNLARAEVALKEVLKRAPDDLSTMERLVEVYRRQNDSSRAVELQQELIQRASDPEQKRKRLIDLSSIYESTGHDNRKAEQALEAARREFPSDVVVLRALVDFYTRHRQMPAVNILLDRVSADTRRAFASGRFVPALFEMMQAVYELRGKKDAARIVAATLAAFEGRRIDITGGEARALDPRLDDLVAPESMSAALRALLARTGESLDAASPMDLRAMRASPLSSSTDGVVAMASRLASQMGISGLQLYTSPQIGSGCLPVGSSPPAIILGDALVQSRDEAARIFLVTRALKLVHARASSLVRTAPADLALLVAGWLHAFNPTWVPEGVNMGQLGEASRRIKAALPRNLDADVGVIALEVAGVVGADPGALGAIAIAWANRSALLAVGDTTAALDGIAMSHGSREGAPDDPTERAAWISRTQEAKDLIGFSVSDAYGRLRDELGVA